MNLPPEIADKVRFHRYLAYNTASKLHNRRFLKQLEKLQNANTVYTDEQEQHTTGTQDVDKPQDTTEPQNTNEPEDTTQDKVDLVTDLTNGLNTQEINILSKGPKFSLSPGINEHTTTAINIAFYRLANQIRWKQFRESNPQNPQHTDFLTYPQSKHIYKPDSTDELENKLRRIYQKLQATLRKLEPRKKWSNISSADKKVIKDLKEKDLVCLPSDKGTEFCIIQKDRYSQAALDHLNDFNTYQKVPRMTAKTIENKVNIAWKNVCSRNKFPPFVIKSFITSNTDLPKFYHLIKTHKTGPGIKIRPIVSNINGPTQRISWLLSRALEPTLRNVPAHLENSYELIKCIQDGDSNNRNKALPYPCSLDVVSLYTSIPIQEAIDNTVNKIEHSSTYHLSRHDIAELLNVTLHNMYFTFEDRIFRQKEGLPMGSSISGILAILFMDKLERIALSSYRLISPYKRYVDDIYLQTTNEEKANEFHGTMNSLHPRLKFEIKKTCYITRRPIPVSS